MERNNRPPREIPSHLLKRYTMNGKMKVEHWYHDESCSLERPVVFEKEAVDSYLERIRHKETFYYGMTDRLLYEALERFNIEGKDVAIMGSLTPLYESICLFYGGRPTTIEYNKIISNDARLGVMTVEEYDRNPLRFDAAFSISSFEHDGLGRYGDPINPDGDLDVMIKMKSILRPKGLLFLAVPVGRDTLVWNAHRIYGKIRLPKLLEGWKLLGTFPSNILRVNQPIFVLENSDSAVYYYDELVDDIFTLPVRYRLASVMRSMMRSVMRRSRI